MTRTSRVLIVCTEKADDIPDQVTHEIVAAEPPYVLVKWKEPQSPNGLIILYEVFYGKVGDSEVSLVSPTLQPLFVCVCVCVSAVCAFVLLLFFIYCV